MKQSLFGEPCDEEYQYASIQITLPEDAARYIHAIREEVPREMLDHSQEHGPFEPHTTVFYGAKDHDLVTLREKLHDFGIVSFRIMGTIQVFDDQAKPYKVLYLPVESEDLHRLNHLIRKALHTEPPTYQEYHPHATICYTRKTYDFSSLKIPFSSIEGLVDAVDFSPTTGHLTSIALTTNDKELPI